MRHWGNLNPELVYIVDLIQYSMGGRITHIRLPDEPSHENSVLQSNPYHGSVLKKFGKKPLVSEEVTTTDGQQFGLDAHGLWLTLDELKYLHRKHRSPDEVENIKPPWVNGIPPLFAPK